MRRIVLLIFLFVAGEAFTQNEQTSSGQIPDSPNRENIFQIDAEYLAWFIKKNPLPLPVVTFASFEDAIPGAIGQPHTRVLLGNEEIGMGWMQGFEVRGKWEMHQKIGVEAAYFLLPKVNQHESRKTSGQPGSANLAVPIFDVTGVWGLNGAPGETIYVLPGPLSGVPFFSGLFTIELFSQFQGAEINALYALKARPWYALEWIGGMRWLQLEEGLKFSVNTTTVPNSPFSANSSQFTDRFQTTNNFIAGQMGLKGRFNWGRWQGEGVIKAAVGASMEEVKVRGSSKTLTGTVWFITSDTGNHTLKGGIFAQPSNSGTHRKNPFAYAVEAQMNNTLEITKNWAIDIGYTFLWISKVLRPGKQIDRNINSTRTALADASRATTGVGFGPISFETAPSSAPVAEGKTAPKALLKQSSFWAQGLNIGLRVSF